MVRVQLWNAVAIGTDGSITKEVYASLDGSTWGLVMTECQRDLFSPVGSAWEAAIRGEDEYSSTVAQTWYTSWEDAIYSNQVDFDDPNPSNVFARLDSDCDWAAYWAAHFEQSGTASPTGSPVWKPKKPAVFAA